MTAKISSVNPADGEVLWQGEATEPQEIDAVMSRASEALRGWRATDSVDRIGIVRRYGQHLQAHRGEIEDLISSEVGKLYWDAAAEAGAAIAKIELSIQAYTQRRSEQLMEQGPVPRRITYQPIGVALVLGPFNFPLHLPGGQIIPALLAGNTIVFKPSEQAPAVGRWMMDAWDAAGLPTNVLQIIHGGVDTAVAAIDSPHVGGVFLTGSRSAGRAIHRQLAGRPGVLLALELGGNNPIVSFDDVHAETVAKVVSFSAFISAGQRCTCARRAIFVEGDATQNQIDALLNVTAALRLGMPGDDPPPQIGPLISADAVSGLQRTYDQLLGLGCEPLLPFETDSRSANLVRPAIVDASKLGQHELGQLGDLEWFGPLLVIQRVRDFDTALTCAADTAYGLAASMLGGSNEMFKRFVVEVGAGVVNWNGPTTGAAGTLPFGGLGDSGNHRPAGFFAIDFCGDPVASLEYDKPSADDPWDVAK